MAYPTIEDVSARAWWRAWTEMARTGERRERCDPPEPPDVITMEAGGDYDWEEIAREAVSELSYRLLLADNTAAFEADACVRLHMRLPMDAALADPGFWAWFAIVPGIDLVLARYTPTKARPIPDSQNFSTPSGKETLFYRLWIRAEMARDDRLKDPYELARYGDVDFWRSHVFRQMFNQHRDFLSAFVRFQYPDGAGTQPRLRGKDQWEIRALVKYLRRSFANLLVELMDENRSREFIESQWAKIESGRAST